ncbi:hypothetical protein D3C80_711610 [compost metagenome]
MGLFDLRLRAEEEPGLAVVVGETLGAQPALLALHRHGGGAEAAFRVLARPALLSRLGQTVRLVVGAPLEDLGLHMAVALEVLEGTPLGLVDRDLMEVDGPQPRQLGVLIGEEPPLQQGVLREVDARHDVGGQEGRLLGLGEEVVGVSVQHHAADDPQRMILFRDQLGRVENIERQGVRLGLVQQLDGELPFREVALIDGLEQIAPMIVRVGPGDLDRLVPAGGLGPKPGPPVELDEGRLPLGVDQPEGVDAEALDHAQRSRNGPVGHGPHHHMGALGHQADEVPERVMRAGRLRIAAVGLHLHGMDQVGEFDRVLDEEDGDVVAHQIPVALGRIEFDGKAPDVARRIHRTGSSGDRREAREDLGLFSDLGEDFSRCVVFQTLGEFKKAMGGRSACMDDPLRNTLMVEVLDLLAQHKILEQGRTSGPKFERVLVVADRRAVVCRKAGFRRGGGLVEFAALTGASICSGRLGHGVSFSQVVRRQG